MSTAAQSDVDAGDLHFRVMLAVADLAVVAFAALVLLDDELGALDGAEHLGRHGRAADERVPELGLGVALAAGNQEDAVELDRLLAFAQRAVDADSVAA